MSFMTRLCSRVADGAAGGFDELRLLAWPAACTHWRWIPTRDSNRFGFSPISGLFDWTGALKMEARKLQDQIIFAHLLQDSLR